MNSKLLAFLTFIPVMVCAGDFPPPPDADTQTIAGSITSLGMTMSIRQFRSRQSIPEILAFYHELWQENANEVDMPPWHMIGTRDGGHYYNVQMKTEGNLTRGYLSISDLPDRISTQTLKVSNGKNFPKMQGSTVINDTNHNDPGKQGRTLLITNTFSAKANHDYYLRHYRDKGWEIVMDEQTSPGKTAYALHLSRKNRSVTLTIHHNDGKTTIIANDVKQGLLP